MTVSEEKPARLKTGSQVPVLDDTKNGNKLYVAHARREQA